MNNNFKKIELHVHLDGSVRPSTVASLLNQDENLIKKAMQVDDGNHDLTDYLKKFDLPLSIMQTKDNLTRVARELAEDLKNDNVIYAEVRFAPQLHLKEGLLMNEVVESVIKGFNYVSNIKINIILCLMRGSSYNLNKETINTAIHFLHNGVCGVDLAGDEYNNPTIKYKDLFKYAKDHDIPFTIHAGEASGANSVHEAISFGARRIGHGVKAIEDKNVINELINNKITLEICPTSNLQTKVINKYWEHPIKKLIDMGVLVTINTDNRTVSNITLNQEYKLLNETFGFTDKVFLELNKNAINASFIPKELKNKLLKEIEEYSNDNN